MKIMHVVEATFAGVGRHIIDLARAQADAGHEVIVLYGTVRESDRFRRARERITHVQWEPIEVARRPDKADLKALQKVRSMARGFKPDVVHGHSTKGGMLARSVPPGPWTVIYTPHAVYSMNPELGRSARSGVDLLERRLASRTDIVIAVSPEEEAHLRIMGIEPAKIRMIPNGIPPIERARPDLVRRALNLPLDRPVIGFVGRIDGQKAPHTLLDVFKRVAVARGKVDFVVVGDGKLRQELQDRADISPTLAGRVHLVGEQPGPWAMSGMDILVLPSRYEGMPYVLIEGAALGLPMVVTRAAGSSLLQDGPATFRLADVGDTKTLADHCIELVDLWPDRLPDRTDTRFNLATMARLTQAAYEGRPINLDRADRGSGTRPAAPRFPTLPSADDAATTEQPAIELDASPTADEVAVEAGSVAPAGEPMVVPAPPTVPRAAGGPTAPADWAPPIAEDLTVDHGPADQPDLELEPTADPALDLDFDLDRDVESTGPTDRAAEDHEDQDNEDERHQHEHHEVDEAPTSAGDELPDLPAAVPPPPALDEPGPLPWDPSNPDDDITQHLAWALSAATEDEHDAADPAWEPPIDGADTGPQPWDPRADLQLASIPEHPPVPPTLPQSDDQPPLSHDEMVSSTGDTPATEPIGAGLPWPDAADDQAGGDDCPDDTGDAQIIDLRTATPSPAAEPEPEPSTEAEHEPAPEHRHPDDDEALDPLDPSRVTTDLTPPMPGAEALLDTEIDGTPHHSAAG